MSTTTAPKFDAAKNFSLFVEDRSDDEGVFLQIYSQTPIREISKIPVKTIEASKGSLSDECFYHLYVRNTFVGDVVHVTECSLLWDGSGTEVPYEQQYAFFSAVPGRDGSFQRIVHCERKAATSEVLNFSEAGDAATLTITPINAPERRTITQLKLKKRDHEPTVL